MEKSELVAKTFGKLTYADCFETVSYNMKVRWRCECGGSKVVKAGDVWSGKTKSCGCVSYGVQHPKQYWLSRYPGILDDGLPARWGRTSPIMVQYKCTDCGNVKAKKFSLISGGAGTSRTECQCRYVSLGTLTATTFGSLRVSASNDLNAVLHRGSNTTVAFDCACGRTKALQFGQVMRGHTVTCGECNLKPASWWNGRRFGRLTVEGMRTPAYVSGKLKIVPVRCSCGNVVLRTPISLTDGSSCGHCLSHIRAWWDGKENLQPDMSGGVRYPLERLRRYYAGYSLIPMDSTNDVGENIRWSCRLCGGVRIGSIWTTNSKRIASCGCAASSNSSGVANDLYRKIVDAGAVDAEREFKVGRYKFDIRVGKLLVEFNGLRYHRDKRAAEADKRQMGVKGGYDVVTIFEDEWGSRPDVMLSIILSRTGMRHPTSVALRPRECSYALVPHQWAKAFADMYHYQGGCTAKLHLGCFADGKLVALLSVRRPSRQAAGDFEISRMVADPSVRVHGVWSKMLRMLPEFGIVGKMIAYSDSRLHTGQVYEKMGMKLEHVVAPDYWWCKGKKRFHKSRLRKTDAEKLTGRTEADLRHAQGYWRVWDAGKIKWSAWVRAIDPMTRYCDNAEAAVIQDIAVPAVPEQP